MEPQIKRKKHYNPTTKPFPASSIPTENLYQYTGYFTGIAVEIWDPETIATIHENGCFGVGSRTKSTPAILWRNSQKTTTGTDFSTDDESLVLFPEESFFLHYSLRCLNILDLFDCPISTEALFEEFQKLVPRFIEHFVAYLYLRSKNWIVKSGLKFGGDFLLYKEGPRFYHASYVVLISASGNHLVESLSTINLQGHHRIAEASKKELLLVEVTYPNSISSKPTPKEYLDNLHRFTCSEVIPKRFNINREL